MQMLTRVYVRTHAREAQKAQQKARRKDRGRWRKEKESRHNQGRITRAIILRVRGRPLPTSPLRRFFLLLLPRHPRRPRRRPPSSLSCLARFSSIFLSRETTFPSRTSCRRCVIRIFFAQMTPDLPPPSFERSHR